MLGFKGKGNPIFTQYGFAFSEEIKVTGINSNVVGLQIICCSLVHQKESVYGNLLCVNLGISEKQRDKREAFLAAG